MAIRMSHDRKRVRLTGQTAELTFADSRGNPYIYNISVDKYLGEGTSCICYEVTVYKNQDDIGQKRVLKQFYPDPDLYDIDPEMNGMHLEIPEYCENSQLPLYRELDALGDSFEKAYQRQVSLVNDEELSDVIVHPDMHYFNGSTKYILYEPDFGTELNLENIRSVEQFLNKMQQLADALNRLHQRGYLYVDLKPSNVLVSGSGRVRLFDFDAAVEKAELKKFHLTDGALRYDVSNLGLIAPEIRPDRLGEFEQNKRYILTEKVDIYSFGAMMLWFFLGRYPTNEDILSKEAFCGEIEKLFTYRYRGDLGSEEQRLLIDIIWKCINKDIGPGGRYSKMGNVVKNLQKLREMMASSDSKRKKFTRKISDPLQAAYVMNKYPLTDYRRKAEDGIQVMDALILGDAPVGESFFSNILACSQMLDTRHVLRLAIPNAGERLREYVSKWPLLAKTTALFLNDRPIEESFIGQKNELDTVITKTPFAEIRFYNLENMVDLWDFIRGMEKSEQIGWMVLCGSDADRNFRQAQQLAQQFVGGEKFFLGYLDERGDGYDLRYPDQKYPGVLLEPFSCSSKYSLEEKNFKTGINKKAKLLHKFYSREGDERKSREGIWEEFISDDYNFRSSLCGALSIPYKLESVGIRTKDKPSVAAKEYYTEVLGTDELSEKNLKRLIYLEHRRWMCFMMTAGYDRPSRSVTEQYAFRGRNDQRNKTDLLHPCICDCGVDNGIMLEQLPRQAWEEESFGAYVQEHGIVLDELDEMSVWFHQLCVRLVEDLKEDGEFEAVFDRLERAMKSEGFSADDLDVLKSLRTVYEKMLDNEFNSDTFWKRNMEILKNVICEKEAQADVSRNEAKQACEELENRIRILLERNAFHDYKRSDRTILEILPLLILSDRPVKCIHKPLADQTWQNLASSLIIEPEQLILYADDVETVDVELIREFLIEKRHLDIAGNKIQVKPWEALKALKLRSTSARSVLDVTGITVEKMYELTHLQNLEKLPVISFKAGKIRSLGGPTEMDYYSVLRRHMTVEETFRLYRANIPSLEKKNQMISLVQNYEDIWKAYIRMEDKQYRVLSRILRIAEEKNYWELTPPQETEERENLVSSGVAGDMLHMTGIYEILVRLKNGGWIKSFSVPEAGVLGRLSIKGCTNEADRYINRMLTQVARNPYAHHFEFIEGRREAMTGRPLPYMKYYIYDSSQLVDRDDIVVESKEEAEDLKAAFEQLEKGHDKIISRTHSAVAPVTVIPGTTVKLKLKFIYYSTATRTCLITEGNILEAYVYHMIWKYAHVDDLQMNVFFTWDSKNSKEAPSEGAVTNEIDLICTRNMQTFFISCKQAMPENGHLQEIKFFADYFGIDGKAILITSKYKTDGAHNSTLAKQITSRSQKMQVYYIDRQMMGKTWEDIKKGNMVKYLRNIFDGKADWKDI